MRRAICQNLARRHPRVRIVAVGASLDGFDDAFEVGADVWVDKQADDHALRVAITGRTGQPPR